MPLQGEMAYHVQIRRLQAALRQSSCQHRTSTCSDTPQSTLTACPTVSEGSTPRRTSPSRRLPLRERSPNQICGGEDRKKRAAVASLFSAAVVADDPFEDLIARAWGRGSTGGVAAAQKLPAVSPPTSPPSSSSLSVALLAACQSAECVARVPTNTSSTRTGASSCAGVCESAALCGSNAKGNDAGGGAACTFSATSVCPTASLFSRRSSKAADTRCRLTSVVAASQPAAHAPQHNTQHFPPAASHHFNSVPSGAASLSHASARTQPRSSTPSQRARRHRTTANAAITSERGLAGVTRSGGAHLSMPQQQRLLSRIQLLDRVIECNRGGKSSAHAAQLLQQVKKDNNAPYFSAGPVDWTAVRRLRERLVGELLGTSSAAREPTASQPQPPPPPHHSPSSSPSLCRTAWTGAGTSPSCTRGEAQEDALPTRATSYNLSVSPPRSLVAPTELCGASTRAAVSPSTAAPLTHVSVESVDPYAESRATFQKEIEAMRRTQALRMQQSQQRRHAHTE